MERTNVAPEYIDWGFYFSILCAGTGKFGIGAIYENEIDPLDPANKNKNELLLKVEVMEMNLFVMIVGESGSGKTNAIKHLPKLIKKANANLKGLSGPILNSAKINLLPEDMTPEAMVKHLAKDCEQEIKWKYRSNEKGGIVIPVNRKVSIGSLVANEMGNCYGNRNDDISGVFNQVYDCGSFSSRRISRASVDVEHSCVSLIGAATPSWLGRIASTTSADEGLLSRFVVLNGPLQHDPYFHGRKEKDDIFTEELARWMNTISLSAKMFYITQDTWERVEQLHTKEFLEHKNSNPHLREYFKRRKRHHWPLAQVIKLTEDPYSPFIEFRHFEIANEVLRNAEKRMAIPFMESMRGVVDKVKINALRELNQRMIEAKCAKLKLNYGALFGLLNELTDVKTAQDVKMHLQNAGIIKPVKFPQDGRTVDGFEVLQSSVSQALTHAKV